MEGTPSVASGKKKQQKQFAFCTFRLDQRMLLSIMCYLLFVSQTCLTAHYGLWKGCTKTLWVADIDPERESCGPAELPGGDKKISDYLDWIMGFICSAGGSEVQADD